MLSSMWRRENLLLVFKMVQLLWKSVWKFMKKIQTRSLRGSIYTLLDTLLKNIILYCRDICSSMFITTLFTGAREWKQPRHPTEYPLSKALRKGGIVRQKFQTIAMLPHTNNTVPPKIKVGRVEFHLQWAEDNTQTHYVKEIAEKVWQGIRTLNNSGNSIHTSKILQSTKLPLLSYSFFLYQSKLSEMASHSFIHSINKVNSSMVSI